MKVIDKGGIGLSIVVKGEKFVGVITDSDIRRSLLNGTRNTTKVKDVMNTTPIVLSESYSPTDIRNAITGNINKFPLHGSLPIPIISKKGKPIDIAFVSKYGKLMETAKATESIVRKILIVGGTGYLGSVLSKILIDKGYQVRVLDNLMYGPSALKEYITYENFEFIYGDVRNIEDIVRAINGVDAVIHLAAIVGDPASSLNPQETIESNYFATKALAEACKYAQINRFIFASTCSVYGASNTSRELTETSKINPVSLYADMKLKSEQGIMEISDGNFSPTIFRMGTLFGRSQRMRFDLVVNLLTAKAIYDKKITIFGGEQYRAFCHVYDAARAYVSCLELPISVVGNQIFNIVSQNETILDVGKKIANYTNAEIVVDKDNTDNRNYAVSNKKMIEVFNNIKFPMRDIDFGINEIIKHKDEYTDYTNAKYSNYDFLRGK